MDDDFFGIAMASKARLFLARFMHGVCKNSCYMSAHKFINQQILSALQEVKINETNEGR